MESLQYHSGDHLDHLTGDGHSAEYHRATKAPMILRVIIIFPVVSLLVVGLRLFTRLRIVRLLAIDDWFILCAMVCPAQRDRSTESLLTPTPTGLLHRNLHNHGFS